MQEKILNFQKFLKICNFLKYRFLGKSLYKCFLYILGKAISRKPGKTLFLGNSHIRRMGLLVRPNKNTNYVSYPGKNILQDSHLFINDIKNFHGDGINLMIGCNDADVISKNTFLHYSVELKQVLTLIQKGLPDFQVGGDFDIKDPLQLIKKLDKKNVNILTQKTNVFFEKLFDILQVKPDLLYNVVSPGPRFMKGPEDSLLYNLVAYFIRCKLNVIFDNVLNVTIVNPFDYDWQLGSEYLVKIHNKKEVESLYHCNKLYFSKNYTSQVYGG